MLIQGVLQGLLIWAIRNVLVALSAGEDAATLTVRIGGAFLIFGIWLLRAASAFLADSLAMRLATRVEIGAMYDVLEKLLGLPIAFFDRHSQGDLVMASYHDLKGIRASVVEVGRLILYVSQVMGLAVAAMLLSPQLALVGMLTVPLGAVPAWWFGQRMTQAADRERRAVTSLHDSFLQVSSGIRAIRVNRIERRLVERAHRIGSELRTQMVRNAELRGAARFLLESVSGVGLILILALGGRDVAAGRMEWPTLMGLLVAVMALYQPIVNVLHTYGTLRSALAEPRARAADRHRWRRCARVSSGRSRSRTRPVTIELRDVSFWYDGHAPSAPAALHHISATFTRGETIGIVGPSGAGKSTLMALLLGFYEPTSGEVLFDGIDARRVSRADLMDLSALVLQEPFLFGASVAENIGAARPGASMAEIERAAAAADLHDEILQMPEGYDTVLGRGAAARGVSVGQKQRIAIAAALLKNAPLLFLDEATSSLDPSAERKVQAAMERLMAGRTTFVIAHRLSTLARADRILVLDQGRLAGLGTHAELTARCPVYARLWAGQDSPRRSEELTDVRSPGGRMTDWTWIPSEARRSTAPRVAIVVDHPERDLAGLVLTALDLARRGVVCHLVPLNLQEREIWALEPDLVLFNYLRRNNERFAAQLQAAGIAFAALDTEGAIWPDPDEYVLAALARCVAPARGALRVHVGTAAGRSPDRAARPRLPIRSSSTGCPRFDLYADPWRRLREDAAAALDRRERRILINTNFSITNPLFTTADKCVDLHRSVLGYSDADIAPHGRAPRRWPSAKSSASRRRWPTPSRTSTSSSARIRSRIPRRTPRPPLGRRNVIVNQSESIQAAIFGACAVIQRSCTTAIEAGLAGVPTFSPQWVPAPFLMPDAEAASVPCASFDELTALPRRRRRRHVPHAGGHASGDRPRDSRLLFRGRRSRAPARRGRGVSRARRAPADRSRTVSAVDVRTGPRVDRDAARAGGASRAAAAVAVAGVVVLAHARRARRIVDAQQQVLRRGDGRSPRRARAPHRRHRSRRSG